MTLMLRKRDGTQPCDTALLCAGWPLPSPFGAAEPVAALAADHVDARPELRRADLVGDVLQHADDLAAADLVEHLAAELRVVALLVDRERAVADDRDAAVRRGDEIFPHESFVARAAASTFGMRWNCTSDQYCAYELPCDLVGLPIFL